MIRRATRKCTTNPYYETTLQCNVSNCLLSGVAGDDAPLSRFCRSYQLLSQVASGVTYIGKVAWETAQRLPNDALGRQRCYGTSAPDHAATLWLISAITACTSMRLTCPRLPGSHPAGLLGFGELKW